MDDGYYDRNGHPISIIEWARLCGDSNYRRVAHDDITDGISVSTIWLGLNHNWCQDGPLEIFETMVFVKLDEPMVLQGHEIWDEGTEMFRWSNEAQAVAGHDQIVTRLRQFTNWDGHLLTEEE